MRISTRPRTFVLATAFVAIVLASWPISASAQDPAAPAPARPGPLGLALNEDDSHFYMGAADKMTLEGLKAFVDQYAGTKVTQLFLCPNAQKASFRSATFDAIWELGSTQKMPEANVWGGAARCWIDNAKLLDERGLDPYAVWIARCREKGISPWLSMRMNDVHEVSDPTSYIHSSFWVEHPEFWRVPGSTSGAWVDRAFDYGRPEVREHHMAFVRELLERYDADGLELDWMRFGYHFAPGHEAEGATILTQFMRDVRALTREWAAKRGHPVRLGARVPAHPDAAVGLGMDGVTWAKEGLVDMLVPTPFWATADFDIPIELWRERLGAAAQAVTLGAGLEINLRAWPGGEACPNDLESARGFAAAELHRGADQIYLFNYMDPAPMAGGPEAYRALLEQGLALDVVTKLARKYVVTYRDTVPAGVSNNVMLPIEGPQGGTLRIYIGPRPAQGQAKFVVALAEREGAAAATFSVTVNGAECAAGGELTPAEKFPGAARAVCFECPLASMKEGYNELHIQQAADQPAQQIVWAELRIAP